jgi:hypothetical protein
VGAARKSRLVNSLPGYIKASASTILRVFAIYEPLKVFSYIGLTIMLPGVILVLRFLYLYITYEHGEHIQSLIIGSILIIVGINIAVLGLLADLIAINRRLNEDVLYRVKCLQHKHDLKIGKN